MRFAEFADFFERMESTSKRLELTEILVELLKQTPTDVISKAVYLIQGKLRPNFEGIELGVAEKLAMKSISLELSDRTINSVGPAGISIETVLETSRFASETNMLPGPTIF